MTQSGHSARICDDSPVDPHICEHSFGQLCLDHDNVGVFYCRCPTGGIHGMNPQRSGMVGVQLKAVYMHHIVYGGLD